MIFVSIIAVNSIGGWLDDASIDTGAGNCGRIYIVMISPKLLIDILGWAGSILYLLAYLLVSMKKTEGDSLLSTGLLRSYQGLNILAGVLLVVYTLSLGAYATTGLNVVWAAIGILTLGRKWLTRN